MRQRIRRVAVGVLLLILVGVSSGCAVLDVLGLLSSVGFGVASAVQRVQLQREVQRTREEFQRLRGHLDPGKADTGDTPAGANGEMNHELSR